MAKLKSSVAELPTLGDTVDAAGDLPVAAETLPTREEKVIGIRRVTLPFAVQEVEGYAQQQIQLWLTAYEARILTGVCLQLADEDAVLTNGKRVDKPIDAIRHWLQQLGKAALIK